MEQEEFEEHVRAALDSLPDDIARGLENVAVVVEDESPADPGVLGSFFGYPRGEPTPSGALPAKIVVYRRPLEEAFPDPDELQRQIRDHGSARARALLRDRRGPDRRARLGLVITALDVVAVVAAIVGAIVIVLFFLGVAGTEECSDGHETFYPVMTTERTLDDDQGSRSSAPPTGAPSSLHVLAEGHDAVVAAEHAEVEERQSQASGTEYREARVRGRFGDRDVIIKRARLEERLDRAA